MNLVSNSPPASQHPTSARHDGRAGNRRRRRGLAGAKLTEALREAGFDGGLTLVGAETHLPYERPPLSKSYLAGKTGFDEAVVHPASWYRDHSVELRLGTVVTGLDRKQHRLVLSDGRTLDYDKLGLATGSTPRRLRLPGADADNVFTLRTREDADVLRARFGPERRLAIIGAGWIGLEVAAAARAADTSVVVIEQAELPLLAVLGPELARIFADLHRGHEVEFHFDAGLEAFTTKDGAVTGLRLRDGTQLAADTVLVGIGAAAEIGLAVDAGLDVDNGVLVDAALRSSDPDIYAVGDIANQEHPVLGHRVRVEHWATALNQPATAARAMLGQPVSYTDLPYFFTDQYDLGMEYVGHAPPGSYERVVVRGDLGAREFVAFWLSATGRMLAAMNVNVWDVVDAVKPIIAQGVPVDPDRLADPRVPYSELSSNSGRED
jgi:NADPH-dependent 2,4-dienoyl-CoA reductase/sulfur reductase-like enzyme